MNVKGIMDISMSRNWQQKKHKPSHPRDVVANKGCAGNVKVDTPLFDGVLVLLKFTHFFTVPHLKANTLQQIESSKLSLLMFIIYIYNPPRNYPERGGPLIL